MFTFVQKFKALKNSFGHVGGSFDNPTEKFPQKVRKKTKMHDYLEKTSPNCISGHVECRIQF